MKNGITRRAATVAAGTLLALAGSGSAFAATGGTTGASNLQCFSGTTDGPDFGGVCELTGKNRNGAILHNDSTNANGDYSGVYLNKKDLNGKSLSSVSALGYTYSGTTAATPGDLSLNLGVDTTGDNVTDAYAYVDAFYCAGTSGVVDVVHDTNCGIWFENVEYANWAALVAAFPGATVAKDGQPFIVAERTPAEGSAVWTISNVVMGSLA